MLIRFVCRPLATLVLLLVLAVEGTCAADPQPIESCEVLARINNEVILACELDWEANLILEERLKNVPPEQRGEIPPEMLRDVRRKLLQQILMSRLDMALFYADFRSSSPQADLDAIHASLDKPFYTNEIKSLMKRTGSKNTSELRTRLTELGTSLSERREDFNRKMIARSWLTETVKFDREVTHEQRVTFYRENKSEYALPARARWEELMVSFSNHPSKQAAYAKLAELGNQVYSDAQAKPVSEPVFADIARKASEGFTASKGGIHPWTPKQTLAAEAVDQAIFSLTPGQMSTILEGPLGFHIVRVLERKEAGFTPFSEVQADIEAKIRDQRFNDAMQKRVAELRKRARVWTVFTGNLSGAEVASQPSPNQR